MDLAAGRWVARRRLHRPTTASRMLALPGGNSQHGRHLGAPPSWRQDLGLQDGVSPQPHGQQDAGAPRGDQSARTTPGSAAILAAGRWVARPRLTPTPRPAGCWRSQGGSVSTDDTWERRHLGGRTLGCKTASHPNPAASRMLALPIDCQSRESCHTTGPALFNVLKR